MKRVIHLHRGLGALLLVAIAAVSAGAQQDNPPPKPPVWGYPPIPAGPADQDQDSQGLPPALNPDQNSLTGAQQFTLGSSGMGHSYWVPGFQFQNVFQSNPQGATSARNWVSTSYFLGTFSLVESRRRSQLVVNYSGGGSVSNSSALPDSYYHELALAQSFQWRRWQLLFLDDFSYLPQTPFGFGGVSNVAIPGVGGGLGGGLPGLQPNYTPDQSVFTSSGPRYSNGFVTQTQLLLSPRSSLTAVGSIGILRFIRGNSIDFNDASFSLGYDYQVTARDTLGVLYRFTGYRYIGNPQALNDHVAQIAYGRKITGRLALQLFAGPEVTTSRLPIGTATDRLSFSAGASLRYAFARTDLSLSYYHGISGGSGVLIGSGADQIQAQISNQLSRRWRASVSGGYARNGQVTGGSTAGASPHINSLSGSAGLSRTLGRAASFSLNYTFWYQNLNQPICVFGNCVAGYRQHQVWVGLQWRMRPFVIH